MLLANAFILHRLGREFRRGDENVLREYSKIISMFLDSNTAPFSIHRIALLGTSLDKSVGSWFGPSTISHVISTLVKGVESVGIQVAVAEDGVVYRDSINGPTLILVPLMLGGSKELNPVYWGAVKALFDVGQCVGVAGGKPNSSFYFAGYQGDELLYFDPHFVRPAVGLQDAGSFGYVDLDSFVCSHGVRSMPVQSMDPSCVAGFYCKDRDDFENLCVKLKKAEVVGGGLPLFGIEDCRKDWDVDDVCDVLSEDGSEDPHL